LNQKLRKWYSKRKKKIGTCQEELEPFSTGKMQDNVSIKINIILTDYESRIKIRTHESMLIKIIG
jgi:hypothetical protein